MPAVEFAQKVLPKLWQSDEPLKEGELKEKLIEKGVEHITSGAST